MKVVPPTPEGLAVAAEALRAGSVVAYPTETVYGLAVDPWSPAAVARLFAVKGRPEHNPVLLIVDGMPQLLPVVAEVTPEAKRYIDAFWPGPLTLLFPCHPGLPSALTAGTGKVAVRCPAHPAARALCRAFGAAITSSSANRAGEPPARALEELGLDDVAVAIDGGRLPDSLPSTLLDPETGRILRKGVIPASRLRFPSP